MPSANALTTISTQQLIAGLYIAFFQRAPDQAGLNSWLSAAQDSGLTDSALARTMAQGFAGHPFFTETYGGLDAAAFLDAIYVNVGGAAADVAGKKFWLDQLEHPDPQKRLSLADFVGDFVFGVLNITPADLLNLLDSGQITQAEYDDALLRQNQLTNKSAVGLRFTETLGASSNLNPSTDPMDPASLANDPAYRASQAIVAGVTHDAATKTSPLQYLNGTPTVQGVLEQFGAVSARKAPWTLLMTGSTFFDAEKILISDGTAVGTDVEAISGISLPGRTKWVVNSDKTGAYFFNPSSNIDKVGYSDGTLAGTQSLAINQPIYPNFSTLVNDQLILAGSAQGGDSGKAYVIDGVQKKSTSTDMDFAVPSSGGIHDASHQAVWFVGNSSPYGRELVRFDYSQPSQMSSNLVKDIYPGTQGGLGSYYSSTFEAVVLPNGKLIFGANDGTNGIEAWVSDGTEAGTFMLKNYAQGDSGNVSGFTPYGGKVAFIALAYNWGANGNIPDAGYELAFTDGTSAGTTLLDINPGWASSNPSILGEANGRLYFTAEARDQTSGVTQKGIYSTNGTTFTKLASINNEATLLGWNAAKAFFKVSDAQHGAELWAADFGKNTFGLVKDILPGSGAGLGDTTHANNVHLTGDKLIFKAYTSATKQSLFVSDGTAAGTVNLGAANATTGDGTNSDFKVVSDTLVFSNTEGVFAVNLAAAIPTAVQLSNVGIPTLYNPYTEPAPLQTDADQAFYLTGSGDLFASKGTTVPTAPLVSKVKQFKVVAENTLFILTANTATNTQSLWYSDGTAAGTRFIEDLPNSDIYPGLNLNFDLKNAVAIKTVGVVA